MAVIFSVKLAVYLVTGCVKLIFFQTVSVKFEKFVSRNLTVPEAGPSVNDSFSV